MAVCAQGVSHARQFLRAGPTPAAHAQGYTFSTLDDPAAISVSTSTSTYACGINSTGQIVGYYDKSGDHGFVYSNGIFTNFDDPAASSGHKFAQGITASGQIVGYYANSSGYHGFTATPTPEPSQSAAFLLGTLSLSALALCARRRVA